MRNQKITAPGGVPIPAIMQNYSVSVPGAGEFVDWELWDTQAYPAAGTTGLEFFLTTNTNLAISNMETSGQLPGGKNFLVRAIGVSVFPLFSNTNVVADVQNLLDRGVLRMFIGSKDYGEWPLYRLSEGGGTYGQTFNNTLATTVQTASNGMPDPRGIYCLMEPLLIREQINFKASITFPSVVITTTANMNVRVSLCGELIRAIQ